MFRPEWANLILRWIMLIFRCHSLNRAGSNYGYDIAGAESGCSGLPDGTGQHLLSSGMGETDSSASTRSATHTTKPSAKSTNHRHHWSHHWNVRDKRSEVCE
jgi:hypothetical protein